jgi:hypothetical protein
MARLENPEKISRLTAQRADLPVQAEIINPALPGDFVGEQGGNICVYGE